MAEIKTKKNDASVVDFLNSVEHQKRKEDSFVVLDLMQKITGDIPKMWGASIIGFIDYPYKYESGRTGEWFKVGFSPRKQSLTLYIMPGFEKLQELLDRLGKYKTGKSCLYINKLEDIDMSVLEEIIRESIRLMGEEGLVGKAF